MAKALPLLAGGLSAVMPTIGAAGAGLGAAGLGAGAAGAAGAAGGLGGLASSIPSLLGQLGPLGKLAGGAVGGTLTPEMIASTALKAITSGGGGGGSGGKEKAEGSGPFGNMPQPEQDPAANAMKTLMANGQEFDPNFLQAILSQRAKFQR